MFLEHKDIFGLKVRVAVANLFNSKDRNQSVNYVHRRDGPVDYARDFTLTYHPILATWRSAARFNRRAVTDNVPY